MEADNRHADIIIESIQLKEAIGLPSPCEEEGRPDDEENIAVLEDKEGRRYQRLGARANYLAQDRCDIQFALKDIYGVCVPRYLAM